MTTAPIAQPAPPPSAKDFYARALHNMRSIQQPAFATYHVHVSVSGATFVVNRSPKGPAFVGFAVGHSKPSPPDFHAAYRDADGLTGVETPQGWGTVRSPMFDPTWTGVSDWMRYGFDGRPESTGTPAPRATPSPKEPPVIVTVSAMGVAYYNVTDEGAATCANGDAGHRVHLIARRDPQAHPLTDAVIDMRTQQLCGVRFGFRQSGPLSASGVIDLDLAAIDGTMLVTRERAQFNVHLLAIPLKPIVAEMRYGDFAFPDTVPPDDFPHAK
ncbi:MAG TPA: hypothetical protein VFN49_07795 [Candidatus Aquilonibacter sp.]|nr:hypothetical protein [Candidatus Aquilonibacter sp.]